MASDPTPSVPASTVKLWWCPECGESDFVGRWHHRDTNRCPGREVTLTYVLESVARDAICNAAAEYAGKGDPANVLLSAAMFQSLSALDAVLERDR